MAMVKCKECKKDVSSKAKVCPNCGFKIPSVWAVRFLKITIGFLVVTIGVVILAKNHETNNQAANDAGLSSADNIAGQPPAVDAGVDDVKPEFIPKTPEQIAADLAACKSDMQCWGDKYNVEAAIRCVDHIEDLAAFDFEWTDGWTEPKLSQFKWHSIGRGTITYIGDKIRFQNEYGAWANIIYECDFDPGTRMVMAVRAKPGRL